jgi:hypothetical protein
MKLASAFLLLVFGVPLVAGQFGVLNKGKEAEDSALGNKLHEASIDESGTVDTKYFDMARNLRSIAPISLEDATDIAVLLEAVQVDPETAALVAQMRTAEGAGGALQAFVNDVTPIEVVIGLRETMNELMAIEILFSNPERAVIEMEKEGLIEKKRVDFYKKNPDVLAQDTRKGVYFTFVSLAVAGGYL